MHWLKIINLFRWSLFTKCINIAMFIMPKKEHASFIVLDALLPMFKKLEKEWRPKNVC